MYTKTIEQRRYKRIRAKFDVKYSLNGYDFKPTENIRSLYKIGKAIDVSGCGLCFSANRVFTDGEKIKISFLIPKTFQMFAGEGKVVRVTSEPEEPCQICVDFTNMTPEKSKELDYFLNQDIYRYDTATI